MSTEAKQCLRAVLTEAAVPDGFQEWLVKEGLPKALDLALLAPYRSEGRE